MPTYEYNCPRCGLVEISHSITEAARSDCQLCGGTLKRLISGGTGFLLDSGGYWEMARDGRERKVPRAERERQWRAVAGRNKPII